MKLGIVPQDSMLFGQDDKLLVDEDEDDCDQAIRFGMLSTSSQPTNVQGQDSRTQVNDANAFSAEREIMNFQTQPNVHFQTCKFLAR